jgi:hypothetical protein
MLAYLKVANHSSLRSKRTSFGKKQNVRAPTRAGVDFCASDLPRQRRRALTRATLPPRAVGLLLNFAESWTARGPAYWRGMASGQHRRKIGVEGAPRGRLAGHLRTPAHCIC